MRLRSGSILALALALAPLACGDSGTNAGAGPGTSAPPTSGAAPVDAPSGNADDCARQTLPLSGTAYCVAAHPDCASPDASCPLYITLNTNGAYFGGVDDPDAHGPYITVESYQPFDGDAVKDSLAELPGVIAAAYPGLDADRIYAVGWSAGAGAVFRGLCQRAKGYDTSPYGTTSDVYAAIVTLGGCPACSSGFEPISGNWHVFATNGTEDPFGGDGCFDKLQALARTNGCAQAETADWCNVGEDDGYMSGGDGSANAQKVTFGACPRGDVVGYRFAEEKHVVSYKKHFDPKVRAYTLVWNFLQGRRKGDGGTTGDGGSCPQ